jgi:branched-chain amino acid transport system substrate-binding protein
MHKVAVGLQFHGGFMSFEGVREIGWPRRGIMRKTRRLLARIGMGVGVSCLVAPAVLGVISASPASATTGLKASAPGITKTTIKIGIFSDLTGAAGSTFETTPGAVEAVFKQINKEGGVDGRKITWVVADSQSSPTGAETSTPRVSR